MSFSLAVATQAWAWATAFVHFCAVAAFFFGEPLVARYRQMWPQ